MQSRVLLLVVSLMTLITVTSIQSSAQKRYVLKFREGSSTEDQKEARSFLNLVQAKKLKRTVPHRSGEIYFINEFAAQAVLKIRELAHVEYFEEDRSIPLDDIPGDPLVTEQWHHRNIETIPSWQISKGEGVIVGVCDTGVDKEHLDINENLILPGYNVVDDSTDMTPIHPHGTSVSGVIAALANNGIGGFGIAPKVKILPIKVSNEGDGRAYYSDLAECIMYAVDNGAKVINLSYGGADTDVIHAAARYARNKGALLVAAAGNSGMDISGWNDWDAFLVVGATDSRNELAYFSNYGTPIDLVAPGLSIVTADKTTATNRSPYKSTSGTSFSAPMVSAVAAQIYSINPELSNDEVQSILIESSDKSIGGEYEYGAGLLNSRNAVEIARERSQNL